MADTETDVEWEKARRIEAEKMKAVRAMEKAEPDMNGLAALGPQKGKVRGWSSDSKLVMARAEKYGTWSAILAPVGVVMMIISDMGSVVGMVNELGMASAMISGIPGGIGFICLGLAVFFGLIGLVAALYYRFKNGQKLGAAGWSGMCAILLVIIYWVVRKLIIGG